MVVRCPRCGSKRVSKNQRSNKFKWECDMCKREFNSSSSALDVNAELEKVEQLRREREEKERLLAQKREREEKERREKAERERLEKQRQERIERERKERLERGRRREEKDRMVRMYKCPNCGNPLYKKDNISGIGQFYHCEHCGHTRSSWDTNNLNTANFSANTLNRCPRCGGAIIRKLGGPRGIFYGCANFPMCDFAYSSLDQNVSQTFTSNITSAPKSYYNEPKTSKKEIWSVDDKRKYKKLMEKKRKKQNKSDISNKSRDKNKRIKDESYNDYIFRINSQQKVSNPKANKEKKKQAKVTKAKLLRYIDGCNIDNSLKVNMKIEVRRGKITDMETLRRRINVEEINYEKVEQQKVSNPKANKEKKKQTYQKRADKTRNISSQPETTTKKPTYDYKPSSSKTSSVDKSVDKNSGNNGVLIIAVVIIIAIIGIVAISSYQEYANTPAIKITDISLTNQYIIDVYGTPKYNKFGLAEKYVDDKIKVKEYTITFNALKDQEDFVLVGQDYSVSPVEKHEAVCYKLPEYTVKNADITYKPKDIKKGKTYKYVIAFCNEPFFMKRDGKYTLDSLTFSYEDNGKNKTIIYGDINN